MGTSTSQPSPKTPKWRRLQSVTRDSASPREIRQCAFSALTDQYGDKLVNLIVDPGVKIVESEINDILVSRKNADEPLVHSFIKKVRTRLATEGKNSFFSDLALQAGLSVQGTESATFQNFCAGYFSNVIDYLLSRDMPSTFGSSETVTPSQIRKKLYELHEEVLKEIKDKDIKTLEECAKLLSADLDSE